MKDGTGKKMNNAGRPAGRGVAKVPLIMQMESLECGAACLAMIMAYHRKWVPLEQLRLDCGVSRDGSNARSMLRAARSYGFEAKGYRVTLEAIQNEMTYPCIIHWNFNHFVVLNGFRGGKAVINDPSRGTVKVSMREFDESFTGVCLTIAPGEGFVPSGSRQNMADFIRKRLRGAGAAVVFIALTTMIVSLFGIINPVMARILMDRILTGENPQWLHPLIALMAALCVLQLAALWVQAVYSLKINGKMAVVGNSAYMWKLLRLPMEFFSQRMTGDILQRQSANASIAGTLAETVAPLVVNTLMMIFYLLLMLRYSPSLTLVGLAAVFLNAFIARFISGQRVNITRVRQRDEGRQASTAYAGISMVETIKASGAENGFFRKWAGCQAAVNAQTVRYNRINERLGIIPAFITLAADYLVLFFGIRLVMEGRFTLGMIVIFRECCRKTAAICPAGRGSASRSPGCWRRILPSSLWMRQPARWTRRRSRQ